MNVLTDSPNIYLVLLILFLLLVSGKTKSQSFDMALSAVGSLKDTTNIYKQMFNDDSDDLMENHPADDIYNNIWSHERINPYNLSIDSLPDSVLIDCSNFVLPIAGKVTSKFGPRRYRYHYGIDLRLNVGDLVKTAFGGKVRIIDYEPGGYGNYVVIRHDNGLETVYAHLSKVLVEVNQDVSAGEMIALGGNTGRLTGPHLHFETRYLGHAINPAEIIDFENGELYDQTFLIAKNKTFRYQKERIPQGTLAKYHRVVKGDTLSFIAARYNTTVNKLCKLNRISSQKILRPGEKIRVR